VTARDGSMRRLQASRHAALLRWGFPLIGFVTTLGSQVLLPRILQLHLSAGEYVSYVAVSAVAGYLSLADGGMLVSILREVSMHHGAGNKAAFAGEIQRARRIFTVIGFVGAVITALALMVALQAAEAAWPGATAPAFRISVIAMLSASALHMAVGSYHSVLQFATGQLTAGQATWVAAMVVPLLALIAGLLATRDLAVGIAGSAAANTLLACIRAWDSHRIARRETASVAPATPAAKLSTLLFSGITLKAADALPVSAYPHLLSIRAPELVPAGVPARTLANACRLIPQQLINLLQVHVTRRLAGPPEQRAQGQHEFTAASHTLCALHLVSVGAVALLVVPIFRWWLPHHADDVRTYMPGLLAEQALLAASMQSTALFMAHGRMTQLGTIRLTGVLLGLAVFLGSLPVMPRAAFGVGFATSAVPLFAYGAWFELRHNGDGDTRRAAASRYILALVAALACCGYVAYPYAVGALIVACRALLAPTALRRLRKVVRGPRPTCIG